MSKKYRKHLFIIIILVIAFIMSFMFFQLAKHNDNNNTTNDNSLLEFEIIETNNNEVKQLELNDIYDYNIYYYGISNVVLHYNNKTFNLIDALKENIISMNEIIDISEKYVTENKIKSSKYLDGGSTIYRYENIAILKLNTDGTNNKDVYIGNKNMDLNDIKDLNTTLSDDTSWLNN